MVIGSANLSIPQLNTQVLPIVFTIEIGVINKNYRHGPISFKHVSLWCFSFDPYLNKHQSNKGV